MEAGEARAGHWDLCRLWVFSQLAVVFQHFHGSLFQPGAPDADFMLNTALLLHPGEWWILPCTRMLPADTSHSLGPQKLQENDPQPWQGRVRTSNQAAQGLPHLCYKGSHTLDLGLQLPRPRGPYQELINHPQKAHLGVENHQSLRPLCIISRCPHQRH